MWIKKSLILILFTLCSCVSTNYLTKESSAFEFVKDQHCIEFTSINDSPPKNQSVKLSMLRDSYSTKDGIWDYKEVSVDPVLYYTPNQYGPDKVSKTALRVILGMVIGGGIGWLVAPKVKIFNHTFAPDGLTYILVGASIGGIFGYFSNQDDE